MHNIASYNKLFIVRLKLERESILQTSSGSAFHKLFAKFWNKVVWAKIWESAL